MTTTQNIYIGTGVDLYDDMPYDAPGHIHFCGECWQSEADPEQPVTYVTECVQCGDTNAIGPVTEADAEAITTHLAAIA